MDWLKNAWLDVAVTVVLVLAVFGHMEWARWAIGIYTPLMLLIKIVAVTGRNPKSKIRPMDAGVPPAVYHTLYAANVLIAAFDRWWWIVACWAAIWILSALGGKGKPAKKK